MFCLETSAIMNKEQDLLICHCTWYSTYTCHIAGNGVETLLLVPLSSKNNSTASYPVRHWPHPDRTCRRSSIKHARALSFTVKARQFSIFEESHFDHCFSNRSIIFASHTGNAIHSTHRSNPIYVYILKISLLCNEESSSPS